MYPPGDSGSAVVDRLSGDIIGILSSGKHPKVSKVRQSKYLTKIFDESSDDVWEELTFFVPASKILEFTKDVF
jgi:hypothetical protein